MRTRGIDVRVMAAAAAVAIVALTSVARGDVGFEFEAQDMHLRWFHMKGHTMHRHMAMVGAPPVNTEVWQLQCDDGDPEYVTVQPFPETMAGRTRLCVSAPTLMADAVLLDNTALATAAAATFNHHGYAIRGLMGVPVPLASFSPQVTYAVLLPRFYELLLVMAQPNFMQAAALNTPLLELAAEASTTATFLALQNDAQRSFVLLLAAVRLAGNEQTQGSPNAPKQYTDVMPRTELTRIVALLAAGDRAHLLAVPAGLARPRACEIVDQLIVATYALGNGLNMRQDDPAAPGNLNLHANLFKTGYAIWKYHATGPTWVGYVQALLGHNGAAPYDPLRYWWAQRLFNRMGNLPVMDTVPPGAAAAQGVIFEARWIRSVQPPAIAKIMVSWFDFHRTFNAAAPLAVPPAAIPAAGAYPRFHEVDDSNAGGGMAVAAGPTLHSNVLQNSCNAAHALAAIDVQHAAMQAARVAGGAFVQTDERSRRAAVVRGRQVRTKVAARGARIARRLRAAASSVAVAMASKPVVWGKAREISKAKRNDVLTAPAAAWSDEREKEFVKELAKAVAETEKAMGKPGAADSQAPGQRGLGTAVPPNWNRFRQLKSHAQARAALRQTLGLTDAQLQQVLTLSAADRAELKARARAFADADAADA